MKLKDVPIGATILSRNLREYVKVTDIHVSFEDDDGYKGHLELDGEDEFELVTKCSNCKHYKPNIKLKDAIENKYYCTGSLKFSDYASVASLRDSYITVIQDPETFSCSLFEMKTDEI